MNPEVDPVLARRLLVVAPQEVDVAPGYPASPEAARGTSSS